MAFEDYSQRKHAGGYTGIRVTGTLDGQYIQRYFKQVRRKEAEALWKKIQSQVKHRASQRYEYRAARYDPPRRTRVVGITMNWQPQPRCAGNRYYPYFVVFSQDKTEGRRNQSSRKITRKRGLEATWRECCQLMAEWRGYKRVPNGWYGLCPSPEDWAKLRDWYNEHDDAGIAESELDVVYGHAKTPSPECPCL